MFLINIINFAGVSLYLTTTELIFLFLGILSLFSVFFDGSYFARVLLAGVCLSALVLFSANNIFIKLAFLEIPLLLLFVYLFVFGESPARLEAIWAFSILVGFSGYLAFFLLWNISNTQTIFVTDCAVSLIAPLALIALANLPIIPFHGWLPLAHVTSATAGSAILAGLTLNLPVYLIILFSSQFIVYSNIFIWTALFSSFLSSVIALRIVDLKTVVAYSSIVHCSLTLPASMHASAHSAAAYSCLSHGIVSPAIFIALSSCLNSRLIFSTSISLPVLVWILLLSTNAGLPPTLALWPEVLILNFLSTSASLLTVGIFAIFLWLTGIYNLILLFTTPPTANLHNNSFGYVILGLTLIFGFTLLTVMF